VAKVAADGSRLEYAGYIGGSGDDNGSGIAVDTEGNAYVTGEAGSTEESFPVDVGPDLTHNGGSDAFVAKIRARSTWTEAYMAMFADSADLQTFRRYRDGVLARDKAGKFYKEVLYDYSAQALAVLEDNPNLMQRASALIEAHKNAVARAQDGEEAVIHNSGEVADFLERFAQESPPELNVLAYVLRWEILEHHRHGERFLGLTWE